MSEQEARAAWRDLIGQLQPRATLRRGLIGDGGGHVEVAGRPGWSWIRYEENQNRLAMVLCPIGYLAEGTWVLVGKFHPEEDYEQVLGVTWGPYAFGLSNYTFAFYRVAAHGETHHGTYGSDPAYIDYANLVMGRVSPTSPASLAVYVDSFVYGYASETKDFNGYTLDLTAEVPAGAGHCYVLVYFDPDTEAIGYEVSATVPLAVSPTLPGLTDFNAIPLGIVELYNGQTEIDIDNTWQRKLLLGAVGSDALTPLKLAVVYEGAVVTHNGEIVWHT